MAEATRPGHGLPATADETPGTAMVGTMGAIGLACAVLIVLSFFGTFDTIRENKARFLEKSIFDVLPGTTSKITFGYRGDDLRPIGDNEEAEVRYYAGYNDQHELTGVALETEGQGFADVLGILYGYDLNCSCIVGMKVLVSKETPGLGDKIETDPVFRANFDALDVKLDGTGTELLHPIVLVKRREKTDAWQIEAISGATISSRAITNMLAASAARAIPFIEQHRDIFLKGAAQ